MDPRPIVFVGERPIRWAGAYRLERWDRTSERWVEVADPPSQVTAADRAYAARPVFELQPLPLQASSSADVTAFQVERYRRVAVEKPHGGERT